jgi:hypothetical protein
MTDDHDHAAPDRAENMRRPSRMRTLFGFALLLAMLPALGAPAAASASTWAETGDAGSLLADAQQPRGVGTLTGITGEISTSGTIDADEDLYQVCLTGESFEARTFTMNDPMLYLFGTDGRLVAFNDDIELGAYDSRVVMGAPAAGTYYLAITSFPNYARDADGGYMDVPGEGPLDHWRERGNHVFGYTIALAGVELCSAPSDSTDPTVTFTRPADGATYVLSDSVTADYACADEEGGSGLASCVGTVANGAPIDTASVGDKTFTVTARDNDGNETTVTHHYSVSYPFSGFFAPVDDEALNVLKAGQAVPVKFSLGGDQGLDVLAGSPTSGPVPCATSLPPDPVEQTVTAGASSLTYDPATSTYTYTWKTDKAWAATCRQLTVALTDGTSHSALFQLTR